MTVRDLEETMDTTELNEWAALAKVEPIGLERIEVLLAQLCSLVFNANRPKHAKAATPMEYMPWYNTDRDSGFAASEMAFRMMAKKDG
jgi:hypothetical protein